MPELPSRVIDVGSGYGLGTPRVFLSRGKRAEYFTLSHCWGGKISPLLTTETLEPFQVALPYSRLPINFKDAIKITRQLGCRYLWIDSLCIIQDSKQDWQQESKKMGSYYGSSTMTICAMASAGSTSGILNPAPRIRLNPKPATLRVFPDGNQECEVVVQRMDLEEETLRGLGIESPLGSRGWTLQESILSPRNLFYGSQYIYWKCLGGCQAADGSPEGTRFPDDRLGLLPALHDTIPKELQSETLDVQTLLTNYHDLVSDYCYRKISFDSDKLPAFSGLARRLHPHIGGDYLAGIWSSDLRRALLWQAEMTYARHVKSYRAPSWSWAVTNEFVATVRHGLPPSLRGLRVVDYNVTPRDRSNPYGELEGATLVVEGLVAPLTRSLQVASSPDIDLKETIGTAKFDDPYGDEELNNGASINLSILLVSADDTDHLVTIFVRQVGSDEGVPELEIDCSKYVKDKYLALLVHVTDCTEDGFVKEDGVYYAEGDVEGLIIRQVDNEEGDISTFQRVGIVRFTGLRILWLDTWDRKTVTLV